MTLFTDMSDLPDIGIQQIEFTLQRNIRGFTGGRSKQFVQEHRDPRWVAAFTFVPHWNDDNRTITAWWNAQRGGLRSFLAYHADRALPMAYPNGFSALQRLDASTFDGTGTIKELAAYSLTCSALPIGFVVSQGDMIGLVEGDRRGLYEVAATATADGSGDCTISIEPAIDVSVFSTSATFNLHKPVCKMIVDHDSFQTGRDFKQGPMPASFSAAQRLY